MSDLMKNPIVNDPSIYPRLDDDSKRYGSIAKSQSDTTSESRDPTGINSHLTTKFTDIFAENDTETFQSNSNYLIIQIQ
jgi:hypothetical protein